MQLAKQAYSNKKKKKKKINKKKNIFVGPKVQQNGKISREARNTLRSNVKKAFPKNIGKA